MSRILIIEDNARDAELARAKLEPEFHVDTEPTLAGGIARLNQAHYDAILVDAGLPDSPRQVTARALKSAVPKVAFVMYSGYSDRNFQRQCIRDNAAGYIVKGEGDRSAEAFGSQIRAAILVHEACELCRQTRQTLETTDPGL